MLFPWLHGLRHSGTDNHMQYRFTWHDHDMQGKLYSKALLLPDILSRRSFYWVSDARGIFGTGDDARLGVCIR
jgi:hypothetical protein